MSDVLLQKLLETLIQVLLPVVLGYVVAFLNAKIREVKTRARDNELAFAVSLVRQMVLAAEQNGLIGAIKNEGAEKKRYVIDLASKELEKHGIRLDLDVLDALVEASVRDALKQLEPLE